MCHYRLLKIERPTKKSARILLLREEVFETVLNEPYFSVMTSDDWSKTGISKSYYYSLLKDLRKMKLMEDNAIAFRAILSYKYEANCIKLIPHKIAFVSNGKIGVTMKLDQKAGCLSCPLITECTYGLKLVRNEVKVKLASNLTDPHSRWLHTILGLIEGVKSGEQDAEIIIS
ncbi:hypothetical protein L3N51_01361 [Metallosphaera sp. J1]|uniref:hypothetical protein n=1 Tax=Metallosphaera TaxID=41980 RepID=UPI001EDE50A4|nr:hypothetical protein [Metallosphaera javensis (ex Hofmann et al. 2022)]MCG3109071.1 hypothetical protein [Metallosphaera javensis (ex Hofmann et al. 2022)]BCS92602.1 MAG: hypothetical protein MjAS7_1210 [Metallosphaera javensis (ex Sakai et al. 2022)]